MGTGLQDIPFRIPEKWSASWYQQHLRDVLRLADSRNSIGVGLTVSGDPDTLATYAVDEDIRSLVDQAFALVLPSSPITLLPNQRLLAVSDGVTLDDNGPQSTITVGLGDHAIQFDRLQKLTSFGVLGRAPDLSGGPEEIIASNDGDVLTVQSDALGFTNTPVWTGIHNWIDGIATTWGTDGDLSILHSGLAASITNITGALSISTTIGLAVTVPTIPTFTINGDSIIEIAQDAVGTILVDSATIDFTYSDTTPSITAAIIADSVTNSLLANMAQSTIKGRAVGAGTGDPTDLTGTQATAILDIFTSTLQGLAPLSGGGTANFLRADATWAAPAGGITGLANPSASVGLTTVNGSATTAMRSDGAPALDQSISPTWSGNHIFASSFVRFTATTPTNRWKDTVSAVDEKVWDMFAFNSTYRIHSVNDAETLDKTVVQFGRSGITPTYMRLPNDNQKLQLGIGQDLNFYHDGTDSWIENDTGVLNINEGATTVGRFDTSSTADDTRFLLYDVTAAALVRVSRGASDSGGTGFRLLRIPN